MGKDDEGGYFGLCPECGAEPQYVNVERDNWNVCGKCRVCWPIGSNLFSSWQEETEADWERNRALLASCREVEPVYPEWVTAMKEKAANLPIPQGPTYDDGEEVPF